jgi:hypothetical protein
VPFAFESVSLARSRILRTSPPGGACEREPVEQVADLGHGLGDLALSFCACGVGFVVRVDRPEFFEHVALLGWVLVDPAVALFFHYTRSFL